MLCNEEYQKYYWRWKFQRLPNYARIKEISLERVNHKEHSHNCDYNAPARILDYSCKKNRDTSYKDSQDWYKTREKCDTSQRKQIRKYKASVETELPVEETYYYEPYECEYGIG